MAKLDLKDFVEEVRKSSCLYNLTDPGYKDPKLKERKWTSIGTKFGFTGRAAQVKWKNIRDRYVRAKRLMETNKSKGVKSLPPKWWLYDILDDFLNNPSVETKKRSTNGDCQIEDESDAAAIICLSKDDFASPVVSENETQLYHEPEVKLVQHELSSENEILLSASPGTASSSSQQSPIKIRYKRQKRRQVDNHDSVSKLMSTMNSSLHKIENALKNNKDDRDDITLFLLSLAPRMRQLNPHQRSQARLKFEQTLFEFESEVGSGFVQTLKYVNDFVKTELII